MTRFIIAILICAWALACGAAPELDEDDAGYDPLAPWSPQFHYGVDSPWPWEDELGTVAQGMSAPTTPNFQLGTRTASSAMRCDKTTTSQVCGIPSKKSFTWCRNRANPSGFSTDQQNMIDQIVAQFGTIQTYVFSKKPLDPTTGICDGDIDFNAGLNACGATGTASNNINDYVCQIFSGVTALSEGAGVAGQYESHSGCIIKLDNFDLENKGLNATEDQNYFKHAVAHGLAGCLGIGGRNTTSAIASRTTMSATVSQTALSGCEQQSLIQLNVNQPTVFSNLQSCGPND